MNQWVRLDERGGVPEGARAEGTVRIEDAVHNDLYDKGEQVTPAVEKLDDFFAAHLVGEPPSRKLRK
ncbi:MULTISPECIES: hypothetical protein [unclassified Streptomyces]|uniref:hypothetical protein n=1 Tax=unclassified Streptomyces TaxID=2593676 RepID=UPI002E794541|nr:hypothetical protein [Streptomyces sp. JV184]MEE1743145.1 hypothetical protein [Streptomyces sp. JV184]